MQFSDIDTASAAGWILAHSVRTQEGRLRKGTLLTAQHVARLQAAGLSRVMAARPDAQDLTENEAASLLGAALAHESLSPGPAHTGRLNLFARHAGLLHVNPAVIHALNGLTEAITVATLPERTRVVAGRMVATIKIIPWAVPRVLVEAAETAATAVALEVLPFQQNSAVLIQTESSALSGRALDKTRKVTEARLKLRAASLLGERRCAHDSTALSSTLQSVQETLAPDWILIAGASATGDRADTVPAAITALGGHIERFGLPTDPGNLLLVARLDTTTVIGLPGCARSPRENGLDWVLDRMAAHAPLESEWFNTLGVGGLLEEIVERDAPRRARDRDGTAPAVCAIVLAAGQSSRTGERNKLLYPLDGQPMLSHVLDTVRSIGGIDRILVVSGHAAGAIEALLDSIGDSRIELVHNDAHRSGMASSLAAGVSACQDSDAVLVFLGDMPDIPPPVVEQLLERWRRAPDKVIAQPCHGGRPGHPVLITRELFDELLSLEGDVGARALREAHSDRLLLVDVDSQGVHADFDTLEALSSRAGD